MIAFTCPPGGSRPLTDGEKALAREMFGSALRLGGVEIRRRKWFPFQPSGTVMAPMGHIHFHPRAPHYRDDFSAAALGLQALIVHELVHVWQTQQRGRWYLPLMRHPFCRYRYTMVPGRRFEDYGIEQQGDIVRHAFLARRGAPAPGAPPLELLEGLLPF